MAGRKRDRSTETRDARLKRLLVSMRSMDETRSGGDMPNGLPRGGRPQRTLSPSYDGYDRRPRQRQRQRQGDSSTEEIIRFVRGYQMEREPTLLRLQKKAVLPGIGQLTQSGVTTERPRRESDSDDELDEDSLVDSEVAAIEDNHRSQLRDLGVYDEFPFPPARVTRRSQNTSTSYGQPASHRHIVRPLDSHGHAKASNARAARPGKALRQLPPIARDELPDRPSAPSPSLTPPGEDEELDSAGEPVDFIDIS